MRDSCMTHACNPPDTLPTLPLCWLMHIIQHEDGCWVEISREMRVTNALDEAVVTPLDTVNAYK